jgi:hypothetical protein
MFTFCPCSALYLISIPGGAVCMHNYRWLMICNFIYPFPRFREWGIAVCIDSRYSTATNDPIPKSNKSLPSVRKLQYWSSRHCLIIFGRITALQVCGYSGNDCIPYAPRPCLPSCCLGCLACLASFVFCSFLPVSSFEAEGGQKKKLLWYWLIFCTAR